MLRVVNKSLAGPASIDGLFTSPRLQSWVIDVVLLLTDASVRQVVALYKGRAFPVVRDIIKDSVLIVPRRSVIFSLFVPPFFHYSVSVSVSYMMCLKNNDEECKSREQKGKDPDSAMRAGNRTCKPVPQTKELNI